MEELMATPRCVKCDSTRFEATMLEPANSRFKLLAVHCASCGAVAGFMDYWNIGNYVKKIAEKLGIP